MAQAIVCDGCGSNMADVMLSSIGSGETKALCLYCLYGFAHVTAMTLPDGPEMVAAMNAPPAPPEPPKRRKRAKPDATPEPDSWPVGDVALDDGQTVDPETGEIVRA